MRRALVAGGLVALACVPAAGAQTAPDLCTNPARPAVLHLRQGTTIEPMAMDWTDGGMPGCDAAGDPITVTFTWGDGAVSAATVTQVGAGWHVSSSHRYQQAGTYRVYETWHNGRTQVTRTWLLFQVAIRPTATRVVQPKLRWRVGKRFSGEVVRYSVPGGGAFPATLRARILWGDGRRSWGTVRRLPGGISVTGRHTWHVPRHNRMLVWLVDETSGAVLTLQRALHVRPAR